MRVVFAMIIVGSMCCASAGELDVLPDYPFDAPGQMVARHLLHKAEAAFEARRTELAGVDSLDDIEAYQEKRREFMLGALGEFPERTPLNATVTGTLERELFTVEKIIFESQRNFFVTGVLYLPKSTGPHPVVLLPCGHSANGKASEDYQRACMLLAINGIAAFSYDPIGQGERYQLLDESGAPRFSSTTEHTMIGVGSILLGRNTATYRVWDGIRAIDYLASRPDVDADRIGCAGISGGGTLTSYLMALDPRIKAAAPGCYITSFQRLLHTIGPQDAEQNIAGQIVAGLDHADYAIMRAPQPTLICAATKDFFDIEGTRAAFAEAKSIYTRLGASERIALVETEDVHGFNQELREAIAEWMMRWLLDRDVQLDEPDLPVFSEQDLQCTPKGQVLLLPESNSIADINMIEEMRKGQRRHFAWLENSTETQLQAVAELTQIRPLDDLEYPNQEKAGTVERDGFYIDKFAVVPEPGIVLPTLVYVPNQPTNETYLIVHAAGKTALADEQSILAEAGHIVVSVDLRGIGETASDAQDHPFVEHFGRDWRDTFTAYLLGTSMTAMRVNDILAATRFVQHHVPARFRERLILAAYGDATVPALHAAALNTDAFTAVRLHEPVMTWTQALAAPATPGLLPHSIHGALDVYDLTNLIQTLPPTKLRLSRGVAGGR